MAVEYNSLKNNILSWIFIRGCLLGDKYQWSQQNCHQGQCCTWKFVTKPLAINFTKKRTLKPKQNYRHFADDFSNLFPWMKISEFFIKTPMKFTFRGLMALTKICSGNGFLPNKWQANTCTFDDRVHWHIHTISISISISISSCSKFYFQQHTAMKNLQKHTEHISRYIEALLHFASDHQRTRRAHLAGNQKSYGSVSKPLLCWDHTCTHAGQTLAIPQLPMSWLFEPSSH